jgi:hypothetical protein
VLKAIEDEKIEMVDLRFSDLPRLWQHFSVSPSALDAGSFEGRIGFDGASLHLFQQIHESDIRVGRGADVFRFLCAGSCSGPLLPRFEFGSLGRSPAEVFHQNWLPQKRRSM